MKVRGSRLWTPENQAQLLAGRLDRAWLFAPASRQWYHSEFGNGLLTTLPVRFWQRIPLPGHTNSGQRNVLMVVLECGGKPIRVLITHVAQRNDQERSHQLASVSELFMALEEPAILMGDLNSKSDDPQIGRLLAMPGVSDPIGQFVESPPVGQIDWILVRGLRCVDAGVRDEGASDHPLYWADLAIPTP